MIRNIVIEGPNNVGKSTLVLRLLDCEEFAGWRTEHLTEKSPNTYEFYDATLRHCDSIIFDRHCLGETIYPYLFNRTPNLTVNELIRIVKNNSDTLFVILSADFDFINNAYDAKGETPDWYFIANERQLFENAARALTKDCANVCFHRNEYGFDTSEDCVEFIRRLFKESYMTNGDNC